MKNSGLSAEEVEHKPYPVPDDDLADSKYISKKKRK